MGDKLRLTVFLDSKADPELYRLLEGLPPRARAMRLKSLALVGAVLSGDRRPVSLLEGERKQDPMHQAARKLLHSLRGSDEIGIPFAQHKPVELIPHRALEAFDETVGL